MTPAKRGGGAVAAALACATPAAGQLVITPTTVTIAPDRHSAVVTVDNGGDKPVDLQFRAYDWAQENGTDRLTPTDGLVISPAIATVAPHGRQVFRVLQVGTPAPVTGERSYRLRLNQLPRPDQGAVAILLEFSLPVFQSAVDAAPHLSWRLGPDGATVTNSGTRRIRLGALAAQAGAGAPVALEGAAATYLLSGATRTFRLPRQVAGGNARLVGQADTGPIDAPQSVLAAR